MKILKRVLQGIAILILLLALVVMIVVWCVDTNRFRPLIADRIHQQTGRAPVIDGSLSWSFLPLPGMTVGHIAFPNPPGFPAVSFLEASKIHFTLRLGPLLHGRIEPDSLVVSGLRLNLLRRADGRGNWERYFAFPAEKETLSSAAESSRQNGKNGKKAFQFPLRSIAHVAFRDATLQWEDEKTHQSIALTHLGFSASDLALGQAFPVYLNAMLHVGGLHLSLHAGGKWTLASLADPLQWDPLTGTLAGVGIQGRVTVAGPSVTGAFATDAFSPQKTLQQAGVEAAFLKGTQDARLTVQFSTPGGQLLAEGKLSCDQARVAGLSLQNFRAPFHLRQGVIMVDPLRASLYEGTLAGWARIVLQPFQVNGEVNLNGIEAGALLREAGGTNTPAISGTGNLGMVYAASMRNNNGSLLQNLNGSAHFSLSRGVLQGVDLGGLVRSALAFTGKKAVPVWQGRTDFGTLTGTALIQNGVVSNTDLLMESADFTVRGAGILDLAANRLRYGLQVYFHAGSTSPENDPLELYGLPLPVLVTGSLAHPVLRLDSTTFLKALAERQLRQAAGGALNQLLDSHALPDSILKQVGAVSGQLPGS